MPSGPRPHWARGPFGRWSATSAEHSPPSPNTWPGRRTPAMSTARPTTLVALTMTDPVSIQARAEKAARDLGEDPLAAIRAFRDAALDALASEGDPLITTVAGGMLLSDYLPTRIVELAVHSVDLARPPARQRNCRPRSATAHCGGGRRGRTAARDSPYCSPSPDANHRRTASRWCERYRLTCWATPCFTRWSINGVAPAARCSDIAARAASASWPARRRGCARGRPPTVPASPRSSGEHRLRCVPGDLGHQLSQLRRVRGHIDGAVELVVEPHRPVAVVGGVRLGELVVDRRKILQLFVGDAGRGPGGQFAADVPAGWRRR